jgi:hypothetical protein
MQQQFNPEMLRPATPKRRKQRVRQHVQQQLRQPIAPRKTGAGDVLSAALLPITLPVRTAWWLLCHPLQLIIIVAAVFAVIPHGWLP